ncbi:NAD-dependent epimerase/dehydratase family protein [Prochlorococcus marinus]|uniref:Nucleoside-diphosphate-sugar epimerase n=1 Tax=Prochlorococcus marinus (strain MIT 9211) TaxID=93059 RepID=A9BAY9_PROM4|nr:NAD(P)-dependent oxidoreductase [Prochlorococcus marinus]ABX09001.1 Nucleoside-diphosphate-sugar epimerase [Prochlorococcus marinus str. MIT 9211]
MKERILITGASGCVGQYTANWLLKNSKADLLLWLRDPRKLKSVDSSNPRIKLLIGDLRDPEPFSNDLNDVTHLIHTATAWGDPERANQVNVFAVKKMLSLINPLKIERIIYFSTASILDKELNPLPEALLYGTEYIQTKARCLQELQQNPLANKIIAVFPTLVFGGKCNGESNFPTSYLTSGLNEAIDWLWLARWFKAYSKFHFIHAEDIAYICGKLSLNYNELIIDNIDNKAAKIPRLVLGQPAISIDQAVDILLDWRGMKRTPRFPLRSWIIKLLIKLLPIRISNWDRLMIRQRHFVHQPVIRPENLGGNSYAKNLNEILFSSGLKKKKKA